MEPIATSPAADAARLRREVARRRTFAIISHPDAGKTTLTEQLLLHVGAIQAAGAVRRRKASRAVTSDWLAIERERGISVTSSAMQVPYKGAIVTILDTPGHDDFSEDTYRALLAADSAVMVIDAGKGVEAQTRKLFAVCRRRGIPILTFVNKLDLHSLDPLELLAHVEEALGISAAAANWPVGAGRRFHGVVDRATGEWLRFDGAPRVPWAGPEARAAVGDELRREVDDALALLDAAGNPFDTGAFLRGSLTPVYFGAALRGFGVEQFFDAFLALAPAPGPRAAAAADGSADVMVDPVGDPFSAFVFKIQANMNPRHRDSMAFLRVCSGRFERDVAVRHHRTGEWVRLARPYATFARARTSVEEAFPGDVIGVVNPGVFAIGDTLSAAGGFAFRPLPQFAPTWIARIRPIDVTRRKAFDKGLAQLVQEGTVQALELLWPRRERCVAAVGRLQFEVLQHRLREEYGVLTECAVESFECAAWLQGDAADFTYSTALLGVDARGRHLVLFPHPSDLRAAQQICPRVAFLDFV